MGIFGIFFSSNTISMYAFKFPKSCSCCWWYLFSYHIVHHTIILNNPKLFEARFFPLYFCLFILHSELNVNNQISIIHYTSFLAVMPYTWLLCLTNQNCQKALLEMCFQKFRIFCSNADNKNILEYSESVKKEKWLCSI